MTMRSGLIVLIVLVPQPPAAGGFTRRFQHLPDHQRFELFGDVGDFFGRVGFVRCGSERLVEGLAFAESRRCRGTSGAKNSALDAGSAG